MIRWGAAAPPKPTTLTFEQAATPSIDATCTLDHARNAMHQLEAGRVRGKIAIVAPSTPGEARA